MPRALITGITGQDGSYLAELLLSKGYEVWGTLRRSSSFNTSRIDHIFNNPNLHLQYADMTDGPSLSAILEASMPHEVYNLAAQSHVKVSFETPEYTMNADALGVMRLLNAVADICPEARYYQASTSEMFGNSPAPQNEDMPFRPRSPYGVSKLAAHWLTVNAREAYGLHASCGILFNHESPRRGGTFVTKKIVQAAAKKQRVTLGNIAAVRDWGYAPEYVEGMWKMLQQDRPNDYVFATGHAHTVGDFAAAAYDCMNLNWRDYVDFDEKYERALEVNFLQGDYSKAYKAFGWQPSTYFHRLVEIMMEAELRGHE